MKIGLKMDVDTFRGTQRGVLPLAQFLAQSGQRATFFFTVGPDNMGRHLFRLFKPSFLRKMLCSNAPGLYGWDILLKGTIFPGPRIGEKLGDILRQTAALQHEVGLHAWDHHAWQMHAIRRGEKFIREQLQRGLDCMSSLLNHAIAATASPGWQADDATLAVKAQFPLRYNSDCRGTTIFRPRCAGVTLQQPQIPTTLPTYDEIIGRNGITTANYNEHLLSLLRPAALNVLCIHAESEGIQCHALFRDFIQKAMAQGHTFHALEELLPENAALIPEGRIHLETTAGREGAIATQRPLLDFRPVAPGDCEQIFNWANDPVLREVSFRTPKPIEYEKHQAWFADTVQGVRRQQYIALDDDKPIGHIRFEKNHLEENEISVYLVPAARGKKRSTYLLNEGVQHYLRQHPAAGPIVAWVREDNHASLGAFRAAGWCESEPRNYLDKPARHFQAP